MHFREYQIYVTSRTQRRLNWVRKARNLSITADQLADEIINESIEASYPQIKAAEEGFAAAEKAFLASFQNTTAACLALALLLCSCAQPKPPPAQGKPRVFLHQTGRSVNHAPCRSVQ